MRIYSFTKRIFDIFASIALIIILSPIMLPIFFINTVLLMDSPIFLQTRYGLNLKPFNIIKFKTMVPSNLKKNELGKWSHGEMEITTFGKFLRSLSLDELPNLFNVLLGHMSIIGPRPLLKNHIEHYRKNQIIRHKVRPGITGLAQVKGRDGISWNKKYGYDVFYAKNFSLKLDVWIILKTIIVIISKTGYKEHGIDPPK